MLRVNVKLDSQGERALRKLESLPDRWKKRTREIFKKNLRLTTLTAQRKYLSGPRPTRLDVVTGKLRASIGYTRPQWRQGQLISRIGSGSGASRTKVPYAKVHEFGYSGIQRVGRHTRMHEHIFAMHVTPYPVKVGFYMRRYSVKARPYLRPALAENEKRMYKEISRILVDEAKK